MVRLRLLDARSQEVSGGLTVRRTTVLADGGTERASTTHVAPVFDVPVDAAWSRAELVVVHDDYDPVTLVLLRDAAGIVRWSDRATAVSTAGGVSTLNVALGRLRFAPGQPQPYGAPSGNERGVFLQNLSGQQQSYVGLGYEAAPFPDVRELIEGPPPATCLVDPVPARGDGWSQFDHLDLQVDPTVGGGFGWLEYGGPPGQPTQPRFLIGVWVPRLAPDAPSAIDLGVFFSPSTTTATYPKSAYPFRDKYPFAALTQPMVDAQTGERFEAKSQPYVLLGYKYLLRPTALAPLSAVSQKPMVLVMPIFPNTEARQQSRPFNSKAGLWRLLLELRLFLQREGYGASNLLTGRLNGRVAPLGGTELPPPVPAYTADNRRALEIRSVVVAGYSRASVPVNALLTDTGSSSAPDYPEALYGAPVADFERRWTELWDLDFYLDEADTKIVRDRYETALRGWLDRDDRRRLRMCHGAYTLKGVSPASYFPQFRRLLKAPPTVVRDPKATGRWAEEWRDPRDRWSALFFSGEFLRAATVTPAVPPFPVATDPPEALHGFTAQLGFGLACWLRSIP